MLFTGGALLFDKGVEISKALNTTQAHAKVLEDLTRGKSQTDTKIKVIDTSLDSIKKDLNDIKEMQKRIIDHLIKEGKK